MTMITPSYLGETIEYSSLHACRSTLEDPTAAGRGAPAGGPDQPERATGRPRGQGGCAARPGSPAGAGPAHRVDALTHHPRDGRQPRGPARLRREAPGAVPGKVARTPRRIVGVGTTGCRESRSSTGSSSQCTSPTTRRPIFTSFTVNIGRSSRSSRSAYLRDPFLAAPKVWCLSGQPGTSPSLRTTGGEPMRCSRCGLSRP